jgi:hypothetical protein
MRELARRLVGATLGDVLILLIIVGRPVGAVSFCFLAVWWGIDGNYVSAALLVVLIPAWIAALTKLMDLTLERSGI